MQEAARMALSDEFTIFEYMYRDAGNYKAFGQVLLRGAHTHAQWHCIEEACDSSLLFVAEQVGILPLYEQLYTYSDGMVADDHAFHEVRVLRNASTHEVTDDVWGSVEELVGRFVVVNKKWDCRLSPHGDLYVGNEP